MASALYNAGKKVLNQNEWVAGDFRCLLVNASYTPDIDAHDDVGDIAANELSGTGYSRKTLATKTSTVDNANDRLDLGADNVTWTAINAGTAAYAIVYLEGASDAARKLVGYIDFTDQVTNGGDFTLKWNGGSSSGVLFRLT